MSEKQKKLAQTWPKVALLIEPNRGYERALIRGIARYCGVHRPWQFVRPAPFWERDRRFDIVRFLRENQPDGIIMRETKNMKAILSLRLPVVASNYLCQSVPGAINIVTDHQAIGIMAADHLLACGFTNFAYCGYDEMFWSKQRQEGFCRRIKKAGFSVTCFDSLRYHGRRDDEPLLDWIKKLPRPTGLMACIDERGQQLMELCSRSDLRVPDDIGIIGVDNDEMICELSFRPMSSVAITAEQGGFDSAERLDQLMRGRKNTSALQPVVIHPVHVVTRQSTDIIHCPDSSVAQALRFIRDNSKDPLSVNDVVKHVPLSRRVLEKRFRRFLGCSILKEIKRCRIDYISRLLLQTHSLISEIALASGFSDEAHIARYFRSQTGMTPRAFRARRGILKTPI